MASFYVIKARRLLLIMVLLVLIGVGFWYIFHDNGMSQETVSPPYSGVEYSFWRQLIPFGREPVSQHEEEAIAVMASAYEETPAEFGELTEVVTVKVVPTKFSEYRLDREQVRSRQLEILESIIYDSSLSENRRVEGQNQLLALIATMSRETELENLLKAKGYLDAVVILSETAVTVVVPVTLSREEASNIGEVVNRLTGIRMDRITIVDEPA